MSWSEITERRTQSGRHYADGLQRRYETILKTTIHYDDGGDFRTVDLRPIRVNNAELDGWAVTKNGWHYALGMPAGKADDGWVGFGGKAGADWVLFRLLSAGHFHWPTKNYTSLATANYDRSKLALENDPFVLADGDDVIYPDARITWENIFPGVDLEWAADGQRLKEEIVVSDAARAVWQNPATPKNETYATFVFELDPAGIPYWAVNGLPQNIDDGFSDDTGQIEMWDELVEMIAFMPIDFVFSEGAGPDDPRVRARKRIYKKDGNYYLLVGIKVSELEALPAGNVIFDPTFTTQPGSAGGKDTRTNKQSADQNHGTSTVLYMHGDLVTYDRKGFIEFDLSSLSDSFTCDDATLYLTSVNGYSWQTGHTITVYSLASGVATWEELQLTWNDYKSSTAWPGSGGCNTAGTDYESGAMGSALGPGGGGQQSINLSASRVEGWFGPSNTNYGIMLWYGPSPSYGAVYSSDHGTATYRPKLVVNYTEGPADPAAAGAVAGADDQGLAAGAEMVVGSVLVASVPPITLNTRGNLFWNTAGTQLSIMLFACQGDDWVQMNAAGTAAATHGFKIQRIKAYLVPQ